MRKSISVSILTLFVSLSFWSTTSGRAAQRDASPSFEDVLGTYGGRARIASITAFRAEAVRLISTFPPAFIERRLRVSVDGARFKRHRVDPISLRDRIELFDGEAGFTVVTSVHRRRTGLTHEILPIDSHRLSAVAFSIRTFGLLPLLQTLSDPATEAFYEGQVSGSFDTFTVKTPAGQWLVYADENRLIRRVEIGTQVIQFADYRPVEGLPLPFVQRLSFSDRLAYELFFSSIELNPAFEAGYFTKNSLVK